MKKKTTLFWMVGYTSFLLMVGSNLPVPLYSEYQEIFGFSSVVLTLIYAVYAFILIPSLWFFGQLSDRIGRKKIILIGTMITMVASLVFSLATSTGWLFLARSLQGLAAGMMSGTVTAALMELHPNENKKAASLVSTVAIAGGTAVGPILAGFLVEYWPGTISAPFLIHVCMFIPAFIAIILMPETVQTIHTTPWKLQLPSVIKEIRFLFIIAATTSFTAWSISAFYTSLVPSYVSQLMGVHHLVLTGGVVFLMLTISALTQLYLSHLSFQKSMMIGLTLLIGGLAGIVIAVPVQSMVLLLLGTIIIGLGWGLAFMGSMALVNEIAPPKDRGHVVSTFYIIIYFGVGLPIIGLGIGTELLGLFIAVLIYSIIASSIAIIMLIIMQTKMKEALAQITGKYRAEDI